jgi:hypothetical protein
MQIARYVCKICLNVALDGRFLLDDISACMRILSTSHDCWTERLNGEHASADGEFNSLKQRMRQ